MTPEIDLPIIIEQESKLVFDRFDEDTAFTIGSTIRDAGKAAGKGLVAGVFLWDRTLFYGATAGSTSSNRSWAERKVQLVRLMFKSSYRVVVERGDKPRLLEPGWGLEPSQYAIAGGAFPIRVDGVGVIGAVAVSGLPERDDHEYARSAIAQALGHPADAFALPAP
ncbi:MAG TPA: heme-degrading domain-containing protein [Devosia sp.]|nr:heme-degrading domain-containing protein [Devosia sp.]